MPNTNPDLNLSPAKRFAAITPSGAILSPAPRGLYIGASGDVTVEDYFGNSVTFTNAQAGSVIPIACIKLTAGPAGIVGLY